MRGRRRALLGATWSWFALGIQIFLGPIVNLVLGVSAICAQPWAFGDALSVRGHRFYRVAVLCAIFIAVSLDFAYEGFAPGLYIVVGGVLGADERKPRLAAARRLAPDAYVKQTTIYLGCTH